MIKWFFKDLIKDLKKEKEVVIYWGVGFVLMVVVYIIYYFLKLR